MASGSASDFNILRENLACDPDIQNSFNEVNKDVQLRIRQNKYDCRITSIVLGILALVSFGIGGYLGVTGGMSYFGQGISQFLPKFIGGAAISGLGVVLSIGLIVTIVRANAFAQSLRNQEKNFKEEKVPLKDLFVRLENLEDDPLLETLNSIWKTNQWKFFLKKFQECYFSETSNKQSPFLKKMGQILVQEAPKFLPNGSIGISFALFLLSVVESNQDNVEFIKDIILLVRGLETIEEQDPNEIKTVFSKHPQAIADLYSQKKDQKYGMSIFDLMSDEDKKKFIAKVDQLKDGIGECEEIFAKGLIKEIFRLKLEYPTLMNKLLLTLKISGKDEAEENPLGLNIYASYPQTVALLLNQNANQNVMLNIFELMDSNQKTLFISELIKFSDIKFTKPLAQAILAVTPSNEDAGLIDRLFLALTPPATKEDKELWALHPGAALRAFEKLKNVWLEIFKLMTTGAKLNFMGDLEFGEIFLTCLRNTSPSEFTPQTQFPVNLLAALATGNPQDVATMCCEIGLARHGNFLNAVWAKLDELGKRDVVSCCVETYKNSIQLMIGVIHSYQDNPFPEPFKYIMAKLPDQLPLALEKMKIKEYSKIPPGVKAIFASKMESRDKIKFLKLEYGNNKELFKSRVDGSIETWKYFTLEDLKLDPLAQFFAINLELVKEFFVGKEIESEKNKIALNLYEISEAKAKEVAIAKLDQLSLGNDRFAYLLKMLVCEANDLQNKKEIVSESRKKLYALFFAHPAYKKISTHNFQKGDCNAFESLAKP